MLNEETLVTEYPKDGKEITLEQAAGLIPLLAGRNTNKAYKARLIIHDPVIRVASFAVLIKRVEGLTSVTLKLAMHVAQRSSYLRQLLVPVLIESHRFDLVNLLIKMEAEAAAEDSKIPQMLLVAQRNNNYTAEAELQTRMFLQTGEITHFQKSYDVGRQRLPWKQAWKHVLRMILLHPGNVEPNLIDALQMLEREDVRAEYQTLARLINKLKGNPGARALAAARINLWNKNYDRCMELLREAGVLETEGIKNSSIFLSHAAKCAEGKGNYKEASEWYAKQNEALKNSKFSAEEFRKQIVEREELPISGIEEDRRSNYFMMVGFPRSGTTLLENALSAHPEIATCEETSSFVGPIRTAYLNSVDMGDKEDTPTTRALLHRNLYYQNLDRYVTAKDSKVVIDKTPILSANIKYMEKVFTNKRYIFSIRHPYDVVLSNWKQAYAQNHAMAAFNDIHSACVQYDQVMTDWFDVFPGETDRVCYVRYDELVLDFKTTIERVLNFLEVDWTDAVMNFADHSKTRAVRTPSYANVRKGLTLGVQTSWQNFDFLFDEDCRKLLDPWVEHFNYAAVESA